MQSLNYFKALLSLRRDSPKTLVLPSLSRTLPPMVADARHLQRFMDLTHYPNHGYLPITYSHVAAFHEHLANLVDPRFPLSLLGLVHTDSRIVQHRPLGAGERFSLTASIQAPKATGRGHEFDLVTLTKVGDELVMESRATMLAKARTRQSPAKPTYQLDGPDRREEQWEIQKHLAPRFALASGDLNPIHLSDISARLFGFKGAIIHGLWSLSRIAGRHLSWLTQKGIILTASFKLPIVLPTVVTYRYWPDGDGLSFCLLDKTGVRPHVVGKLEPPGT